MVGGVSTTILRVISIPSQLRDEPVVFAGNLKLISTMANYLERLPLELIENIYKSLEIKDLLRIVQTSKRLNEMKHASRIWKGAYMRRWPEHNKIQPVKDWYTEVKYLTHLESRLDVYFQKAEATFENYPALSDGEYEELIRMSKENKNSYYYVVRTLRKRINRDQMLCMVTRNLPCKKHSLVYYMFKGLQCVVKQQLRREWQENEQADEGVKFEKGFQIFTKWFQPNADFNLQRQLDRLAETVLQVLRKNHPIFQLQDFCRDWRDNGLKSTKYNASEAMEIIFAMRKVIGDTIRVPERTTVNGLPFAPYFMMNKVFETGNCDEIILLTVYEAVARRLGIKMEPIRANRDIYLRYIDQVGGRTQRRLFICRRQSNETRESSFFLDEDFTPGVQNLTVQFALNYICAGFKYFPVALQETNILYGWTSLDVKEFTFVISQRDPALLEFAQEAMCGNVDTAYIRNMLIDMTRPRIDEDGLPLALSIFKEFMYDVLIEYEREQRLSYDSLDHYAIQYSVNPSVSIYLSNKLTVYKKLQEDYNERSRFKRAKLLKKRKRINNARPTI